MQLRSKFSDNVRTFKNKTIDRFVIHMEELIKQEPWLKDATISSFKDRLAQKFNHQNWAFCFFYMKEYIDWGDSKSLRANYSTRHNRRQKRYWKAFFLWLLDLAITNSYLISQWQTRI
jgi:hypothetical protein